MSSISIRRYIMPIMVVAALAALALVTLFPSKTDTMQQSRTALAVFEKHVNETAQPAEQAWSEFKRQTVVLSQKKDFGALSQAANQTYDTINQVGATLAAIPIPKLHNTHARQAAWKALEDTRARYTMLAAAAQVWIKMAGSGRVTHDELIAIEGVEKQAAKYQRMIPGDFALARSALAPSAKP
ncbi:hypothetical protein [Acidihalobacter prosperus]|uniref:Uncharacterized protein n=1 Tax=Acidihalobacter prosperus TaxID=160660 RepID=A0A1A6C861_9GAMM|nr:hypothetical protein [Acidihalobacter prosperus]OBS10735.1 hypothetical protein Thpro_020451 [Acidihalobacter prosperus]